MNAQLTACDVDRMVRISIQALNQLSGLLSGASPRDCPLSQEISREAKALAHKMQGLVNQFD